MALKLSMKKLFFLLIGIFCLFQAKATHNRAGEITYVHISGLTFEFTITTYTRTSSVDADRSELEIFWGDGTSRILPRTSEQFLPNDIKINRYVGRHTYSGPFTYVVFVIDPNRIGSVINMTNSINVPFYLEDTLRILDPVIFGFNSSPQLLNPPIDFGNVNQVFVHNPNAFDPDGDSLSYQLVPPKQGIGVNVPGYVSPTAIGPGPDNQITLNQRTGELRWDSPKVQGIYNIAFLIREYRNGQMIGTVLRDLQIIIQASNNRPPVLEGRDLICVVAGDSIHEVYTATDPDPGTIVTISSNGAPYVAPVSPATFSRITEGNPASSRFRWQTVCNHLRNTDYQMVVKAEDNAPVPLVDLRTVVIRVVAPAPANLQGQFDPFDNTVTLTWNSPYACASNPKFIGFSVWRKRGCGFIPDTCSTSLIDKGFTKIGETNAFSFIDDDLRRGNDYSYVVVADFADRSQIGLLFNRFSGLPSQEFCLELPQNLPVIYNVDVKSTSASNGIIFTEWSKPNAEALDTLLNPPPYLMRLSRAEGINGQAYTNIFETAATSFSTLTDTSFIDSNLNTLNTAFRYKVDFFVNGNDFLGNADPASSIYLNLSPSDRALLLNWNFDVPWLNEWYYVYKQEEVSGIFLLLDSTTSTQYLDAPLSNDSTYCYKVEAKGRYTADGYKEPLVNFSQEACGNPRDTIPPCPPVLAVSNYCIDNQLPRDVINYLSWTIPSDCPDSNISSYHIYYKSERGAEFTLIDSVVGKDNKQYNHELDLTLTGCYSLRSTDPSGNISDFSTEVCVSDCPDFKLPNAFTPNNDGKNDLYTPILPYSGVTRIQMKIFNRWGNLVFETDDPDINWDGSDIKTGKQLPTAAYYYVCEVYFNTLEGEQKLETPLSGYIHLFREK
jgi:gliding motility-associated-like protein